MLRMVSLLGTMVRACHAVALTGVKPAFEADWSSALPA
jgi:hypothetical protein